MNEDKITISGILSIVIPPVIIFGIAALLMFLRPDEAGASSWEFITVTIIVTAVSYFGNRGIREREACREEIRQLREQLTQMSSVCDISSERQGIQSVDKGEKQ